MLELLLLLHGELLCGHALAGLAAEEEGVVHHHLLVGVGTGLVQVIHCGRSRGHCLRHYGSGHDWLCLIRLTCLVLQSMLLLLLLLLLQLQLLLQLLLLMLLLLLVLLLLLLLRCRCGRRGLRRLCRLLLLFLRLHLCRQLHHLLRLFLMALGSLGLLWLFVLLVLRTSVVPFSPFPHTTPMVPIVIRTSLCRSRPARPNPARVNG